MTHVFISYVHENCDIVHRMATELRKNGVIVWLDRDQLEPGARWQDAIRNAIQSGKHFICCFSIEYNARLKTYMNEELSIAIDELRLRPTTTSWFIPVLINETDIPTRRISSVESLAALHAVRLDEGRILFVNLSKGALGEGTAHLLGALITTGIAQAALSPTDIPEHERHVFHLYADEFQSFATESFALILSEARKYALTLTLGHQYLGQLSDSLRQAVLGNTGSFIAFRVGAEDAPLVADHLGIESPAAVQDRSFQFPGVWAVPGRQYADKSDALEPLRVAGGH